ncbi:MAG: hypothetical protein SFX73_33175 [Kofleriaceae bacterium]|nr:hypothetical protein [Kofleriaceae bacterium]
MIRAGSLSASFMVTGILLVLVGLTLCIRTIMRLRWVSQLRDVLVETARGVIHRRNREQRALSFGAVFVVAGLACYLGAVVIARGGRTSRSPSVGSCA